MSKGPLIDYAINSLVLILGAILIGGYIYMDYSWFNSDNKITDSNRQREDRDERQLYYNSKIREIYQKADNSADQAIKIIDTLSSNYPDKNLDLNYVLSRVHLLNDDLEKAKSIIDQSMNSDSSKRLRYLELLAYYHIQKGNTQLAFDNLTTLNQQSTNFRFQLANYYEVIGDDSVAMQHYNEIISNNYSQKKWAQQRILQVEEVSKKQLENIILSDDTKRVYFTLGGSNIKVPMHNRMR